MRKTLSVLMTGFITALLASVFLLGCNTVEGAGEDVESVGEGMQDAVDDR